VTTTPEDLRNDIAALKAALVEERAKRIEEAARAARVEAELAVAKAKASDDQAVIAHQQLQIAKLTRQLYGQRSERTVRLLDQMELALEELESSATEDEIAAERAVAKTTNVMAFTRKRPARQPFPEHLPRERVVEPGPTVCLCCGSPRLRKLGEDITETLEVIPRSRAGVISVSRWLAPRHESNLETNEETASGRCLPSASWAIRRPCGSGRCSAASREQPCQPLRDRKFADSSLEGAGFEPSVPDEKPWVPIVGMLRLLTGSSSRLTRRWEGAGFEPSVPLRAAAAPSRVARIRSPVGARVFRSRCLIPPCSARSCSACRR
jgi:hypothetical protein